MRLINYKLSGWTAWMHIGRCCTEAGKLYHKVDKKSIDKSWIEENKPPSICVYWFEKSILSCIVKRRYTPSLKEPNPS